MKPVLIQALVFCFISALSTGELRSEENLHVLAQREHQLIADRFERSFQEAASLSLYSLRSPAVEEKQKRKGGRYFLNYRIRRQKENVNPNARKLVLEAIINSIRSTGGQMIYCFMPKHGIRMKMKDGTVCNLIICFECAKMKTVGMAPELVLLGSLPETEALLDRELRR